MILVGQLTAASPPATAHAADVPAQYLAKLYTEGLGRAPDQAGWAARVAVFDGAGCTVGSLEQVGKSVLETIELSSMWGRDPAALAEIAFRAVLNREPDPDGFRALAGDITHHGWDAALSHVFEGGEFASLAGQICSTTSSSYGFNDSTGIAPAGIGGPVPACTSCLAVRAPVGAMDPSESQLRLLASIPGNVIALAPRAVIKLTQPLVLARNVTIETAGLPGPSHYVDMARLVRDFASNPPGMQNSTVVLQGGAILQSVWVSGQRARWRNAVPQTADGQGPAIPNAWGQVLGGSDVQLIGGIGTSVLNSRIDDSPGWSTVELLGADGGNFCLGNVVQGNLIEAYSSVHEAAPTQHDVVPWTDGISDHCQSSTITMNQVIDATDIPIVMFQSANQLLNPAQSSQISSNVLVSAGNSAYSALGADPGWNPVGPGDAPGGPGTRDFTGGVIGGTSPVPVGGQPTAPGQGNLLWTGPRTHFNAVISDGTTDFYGFMAYDGHGAQVLDNTTGSGQANAAAGIVVSGMMNTVVKGNSLAVALVRTGPNHIWRCSGAQHLVEWFFPQRASGDVQGNPIAVQIPPPNSPGCIVAGT